MYATTTTGHSEHVSVNKDMRVLQTLSMGSTLAKLVQKQTTTTETWVGLNYTDALSVCVASESSVLNGITRAYLGTARLTLQYGTSTFWTINEGCWGTKVSSQLQRMGETNCYQVTKTTQQLEVVNYGGTLTLL